MSIIESLPPRKIVAKKSSLGTASYKHADTLRIRSANAHDMLAIFDKLVNADCGVNSDDKYSIAFIKAFNDIENPNNIEETAFAVSSLLGCMTPQIAYTPYAVIGEDQQGSPRLRLELVLTSQDPNLELNDETVANVYHALGTEGIREKFTEQVYNFYKQTPATAGRIIQ